MPNQDQHHPIVVRALQKAGWKILKEQHYVSIGTSPQTMRRLYIDLQAQSLKQQIVLIEVKSLADSPVHELMELVGQYLVYRAALDYLGDQTPLYVAIPQTSYVSIVQHLLGQQVLQKNPIPFVIYDVVREEIVQWIPPL